MSRRKPTVAASSRLTEQLVALMHYEMGPSQGCGSAELTEELLLWMRDLVLNPEGESPGGDLTDEQMQQCHRECLILAEHLLMAIVAMGRSSEAERYVEAIATRRRECEARFGSPRRIPFSADERERLSKSWGSGRATIEKRSKEGVS